MLCHKPLLAETAVISRYANLAIFAEIIKLKNIGRGSPAEKESHGMAHFRQKLAQIKQGGCTYPATCKEIPTRSRTFFGKGEAIAQGKDTIERVTHHKSREGARAFSYNVNKQPQLMPGKIYEVYRDRAAQEG